MWKNRYKDYPEDGPLVEEPVEPGRGIVGCEMHDVNGWNETRLDDPYKPKGYLKMLFEALKVW